MNEWAEEVQIAIDRLEGWRDRSAYVQDFHGELTLVLEAAQKWVEWETDR